MKRVAILRIPLESLLALADIHGLPDDVEAVAGVYDFVSASFEVLMKSRTFQPVPAGAQVQVVQFTKTYSGDRRERETWTVQPGSKFAKD